MTFAKLNGDRLDYWRGHITIDRVDVFTTDPRPYGFKVVVYPDPPVREGYIAVPDGWEETDTEIRQKWKLEPEPVDPQIQELAAVVNDAEQMAIDLIGGM